MQMQNRLTSLPWAWLRAGVLFAIGGFVLTAGALSARAGAQEQTAARKQSMPAANAIPPDEQAGIDEDIAEHVGSAPENPGPRAKLSGSLQPAAVRAAMSKVAKWELGQAQPYFDRTWMSSALYDGFLAASPALHDRQYHDAVLQMAEHFHWQERSPHPNADDESIAQSYIELYLEHSARERIEPTETALATVIAGAGPPIAKDQAQIPWWWCDALFMAPPVWARMYAATHDRKYLDYLDKNFWQTSDLLYDTQRHLYFRDITFVHKRDSRGNPIYWSRGEGWVMGGIARTLEYLPRSDPDYARYQTRLRQMAAAVAALQDAKDGLWHSNMLDAEDYPQPEVSGSSFMTFALAWGVNHGVLDRATYMPTIARAWRGLVEQIYADGRLGNIQQTGGAPAHYLPSSSYDYGVGAFLLAGAQIVDLPTNGIHGKRPSKLK